MSNTKKHAWQAIAALASLLVVAGVLVAGPAGVAHADHSLSVSATSVAVGGTVTVTAGPTGIASGQTVIAQISSGSAQFVANSGQSIVVTDNGTGDTNSAAGVIGIAVRATGAGAVIVAVTESGYDGDTKSVGFNVTAAATPGVVTLTSPTSLSLGGTGSVTANVQTSAGVNIAGATVSFSASGPGSLFRTSSASTACATSATGTLATSCTATTDSSGNATAWVQSTGASGVISVTATSGSVSDSDSIAVVGTTAGLEITTVVNPNVGAGGSTLVRATATDAAGTGVPGQTVTFTTSAGATLTTSSGTCPGSSQTQTATTGATGVATVLLCVPAGTAPGTTFTITSTTVVGTTTLSDTETVTVSGVPSVVTITPTETTVATGGTTTVTFAVVDADGRPVAAGTTLDVAVTGGVLAGCTDADSSTAGIQVNASGEVTCTFVAPGTAQTVTISAVATRGTTTVVETETVTVGTAPPPAAGEGFDRPIDDIGINTAVWEGGTVAELAAATAAVGGTSVTVFVGGEAVVLIPGAPAFVNAAFNAAFPDGTVPEGTIVLVAVIQ